MVLTFFFESSSSLDVKIHLMTNEWTFRELPETRLKTTIVNRAYVFIYERLEYVKHRTFNIQYITWKNSV